MLHDVVAGSGLAIFAEVALVIFFVTFLVVVFRVMGRNRNHYEALARMPLEDEPQPVARLSHPSRREK